MKLVCEKSELVKGVQTAIKAVPAKTTMPVLECILIEAEGEICFTGNNLELGIKTAVKGTIVEKGVAAVNARVLSMIVRKMPDGDVTLETNGEDELQVFIGKVKYKIPAQSGAEYARIPEIEKKDGILLSEFELKEAIRQTIFSVAHDDSKKIMTGELFNVSGREMKVVSLDGYRISVRRLKLGKSYDARKVIVPGKTLVEIGKIISGSPEKKVWIYLEKNHILFEMGETTAVSRLIEGEYFNVERALMTEHETKMVISRKQLEECIDRAGVFQKREDKKPVRIKIKKDSLEMKVVTSMGGMDEKIPIKIEGKELEIAFNPVFLLELLRVIDDDEIEVYLKNANSPCVVRDEAENYIYMLLPVNIKNAA